MIETDGEVLDGPTERMTKRRRSSSDEEMVVEDENLQTAKIVGDMIDETPEPPPPIQVSPPKKTSPRRRPVIRPPPDGNRPKHFQHSPINPSPLRFMSKLTPDSPETPPAEIPSEADPQDHAGTTVDDIPAYKFLGSLYGLSSIGPQRTSRGLMTAKQKAVGFKPYYLPEFLIVNGKHPHHEVRIFITSYNFLFTHQQTTHLLRIPRAFGPSGRSGSKTNTSSKLKLDNSRPPQSPGQSIGHHTSTGASKQHSTKVNGVKDGHSVDSPVQVPNKLKIPSNHITKRPSTSTHAKSGNQPTGHDKVTSKTPSTSMLPPPNPPHRLTPAPSPSTRSFDWAAAGLKPPTQPAGTWSCGTCLTGSNSASLDKCACCETPRSSAIAV
jgi:hypothetical protein